VEGLPHQLWRIEKSFRMSKHDLQARPKSMHTRQQTMLPLTTTVCWRGQTSRRQSSLFMWYRVSTST
jgi:hypothetical protein